MNLQKIIKVDILFPIVYNITHITQYSRDLNYMFVIFISKCSGKSLSRTQHILDMYAQRISNKAWSCDITNEGLMTIKQLLSKKASRYTDVEAFRIYKKRLHLLWSVGKQHTLSIHNKRKNYKITTQDKIACLLASTAGLSHDTGKATMMFQSMLQGETKNNIRHEWVSAHIINNLLNMGKDNLIETEQQLYDQVLPSNKTVSNLPSNIGGITNIKQALLYCIVSHHRLLDKNLGTGNHVYNDNISTSELKLLLSPTDTKKYINILRNIQRNYNRMCTMFNSVNNISLQHIVYMARSGLIFADHTISSLNKSHTPDIKHPTAFANTVGMQSGIMNQQLIWHLHNVGRSASNMVYNMLLYTQPNSLSDDTISNILKTPPPQYNWYKEGADNVNTTLDVPSWVVLTASTGTGKTFANARCAVNINQSRQLPVCFINALNLRTLTTQTSTKYRQIYKTKPNEVTTILGGSVIVPDTVQTQVVDEDHEIDEFDTDNDYSDTLPSFLDVMTRGKSRKAILSSVILNSTIDHIIAAGNPGKQANQGLALLKLKDNVLILDEIDSYDTNALVDVSRLIYVAGLVNCSVIISSATIRSELSDKLFAVFHQAVLSAKGMDVNIPVTCINEYEYITTNNNTVPLPPPHNQNKTKLCEIIQTTKNTFFDDILDTAIKFHDNHHNNVNNVNISFGLIRFANVKPLIEFCDYGCTKKFKGYDIRIGSYHSNVLRYQRTYTETKLDALLNRNVVQDYSSMVSNATASNIIYITVASPVEEIGRDHDFDWGVLEPSSMHAIVQGAGRINRHRQFEVVAPNIAILQYNYKCLTKSDKSNRCFIRPGLEGKDKPWYTHNMIKLLNYTKPFYITNHLMWEDNPMNKLESNIISNELKNVDSFCNMSDNYITQQYYDDYALRECNHTITIKDTPTGSYVVDKKDKHTNIAIKRLTSNYNNWLLLADTNNINKSDMIVSLPTYSNNPNIINHDPWGYFI